MEQEELKPAPQKNDDQNDGKKSIWVIAGEYSSLRIHPAELRICRIPDRLLAGQKIRDNVPLPRVHGPGDHFRFHSNLSVLEKA